MACSTATRPRRGVPCIAVSRARRRRAAEEGRRRRRQLPDVPPFMFQRLEPISHPDIWYVRHADVVAARRIIIIPEEVPLEPIFHATL